jgi:hypothetical protein
MALQKWQVGTAAKTLLTGVISLIDWCQYAFQF